MTQRVRGKMRVTTVTTHDWSQDARTVRLTAEYDDAIEEERRYAKATPQASMEMVIDNPAITDFFRPGAKFYVDFTPADD